MAFWDFLTVGANAEKALGIVEKAEGAIIAGIDKMWFTAEEKSEASLMVTNAHIELMKALAGENSARAITRRLLAMMFCGTFLSLLIIATAVWKFDPIWSKQIFEVVEVMSNPVLAIVIFYFGYYGIGQVMDKRKKG